MFFLRVRSRFEEVGSDLGLWGSGSRYEEVRRLFREVFFSFVGFVEVLFLVV